MKLIIKLEIEFSEGRNLSNSGAKKQPGKSQLFLTDFFQISSRVSWCLAINFRLGCNILAGKKGRHAIALRGMAKVSHPKIYGCVNPVCFGGVLEFVL